MVWLSTCHADSQPMCITTSTITSMFKMFKEDARNPSCHYLRQRVKFGERWPINKKIKRLMFTHPNSISRVQRTLTLHSVGHDVGATGIANPKIVCSLA